MLQFIYILLVIINLFVFLFTNKKITFLFVYFLSSCLYYSNAFWGSIFYSSNNHISGMFYDISIDDKTYTILIINMLIILFFSIFEMKKSIHNIEIYVDDASKDKSIITEKMSIKLLIIINCLISIYVLIPIISILLNGAFDKGQLLSNESSLTSYFKIISTFLFVYFFTKNKQIKYNIITAVLILYFMIITLLLGHRSYLVIGIIAILVYIINNNYMKNCKNLFILLKKNYKKIITLILFFLIFIITKNIYTSLYNGYYSLVFSRLTNWEYYINSFKLTEFNTIINNLNTIVVNNFSISPKVYLKVLTLVFPFLNRFLSIPSFTYSFQSALFTKNNMASTFIGESFSVGGNVIVATVVIFVLTLNVLLSKKIEKTTDSIWRTFLLITAVELSFYIHRNSLETTFIRIRSLLYISLLIKLFNIIFLRLRKEK